MNRRRISCWHPATMMMAVLPLLFFTDIVFAGTITAELSRTEINIAENAELHVTIEGSLDGDVEIPVVDGLLFQQAGRSNQMNFSNGSFSHTLTLIYIIRAQKTGTFTIPSIKVVVDKKSEGALPLTLMVTGQGGQGQQQGQANQGNNQGNQSSQQGGLGGQGQPGSQAVKQTAGVFLERECDKKDPYVGEQVICYIRIYHRNNIYSGQRQGDVGTDFRRFSVEGERKYVRQVEGRSYGVIELREVIVPLKPGKATLPPAGLAARIAIPNRRGRTMDRLMDQLRGGLFNMDPFNDEQEVLLESNPIDMDVKPLPEQDKPKTFSGVVGNVIMTAQVSSNHVKAGENLTITIEVSGHAILDTLADPALTFPDIGKVYNDKPEYSEKIDPEKGISSSKTFKIALVPVKAGTYNLGSWELSFFDPQSMSWKTLNADLGTIVVDPSKAEEQLPGMTTEEKAPQSVKLLGQDMIGPHRNVHAASNHFVSAKDRWFYLLGGGVPLGASLMFMGASLLWGHRQGNDQLVRNSRAGRAAEKTAAELRKRLGNSGDTVGAADALMLVKQYFGDKSGRQGSALTSGDMLELTRKHGGEAHAAACAALLKTAERLEYGGGSSEQQDRNALLTWVNECSAFLRDLDRSWNGKGKA